MIWNVDCSSDLGKVCTMLHFKRISIVYIQDESDVVIQLLQLLCIDN